MMKGNEHTQQTKKKKLPKITSLVQWFLFRKKILSATKYQKNF